MAHDITHDITQAEQRPVDQPAAPLTAPPPDEPGATARTGWLGPAAVAAVAAFVVGWVTGVRWAWREMGPRHRRRAAGRG